MNVALLTETPCPVCGCRVRGVAAATVRLRPVKWRLSLTWPPGRCPECQASAETDPPWWRWVLSPDDAARVAARGSR